VDQTTQKEGGKTTMLQYHGCSIMEYWKLRTIAKKVRAGIVPKGVPQDVIFKALRATNHSNVVEVMGFLSAIVHRPDGELKKDYGLVAVKEVTSAFCKRLVDAMCDSAVSMSCFNQHKMGAGSTAETDTDTALVTQQTGSQSGNGTQTHGTGSNIYQSVGTLTAGSAYGCREHGLFSLSTGGVLLDRSVVTNIDLNTDDIVTWTYQLTATAGG
jgi:hypothetical protein